MVVFNHIDFSTAVIRLVEKSCFDIQLRRKFRMVYVIDWTQIDCPIIWFKLYWPVDVEFFLINLNRAVDVSCRGLLGE